MKTASEEPKEPTAAEQQEKDNQKKQEKKELGDRVFSLWKKTSKKGTEYFSGVAEDGTYLKAFMTPVRTKTAHPKAPDISIKAEIKGSEKHELEKESCAVLWQHEKYLSGTDNEGKKLTGFYNKKSDNQNRPDIVVYYDEKD